MARRKRWALKSRTVSPNHQFSSQAFSKISKTECFHCNFTSLWGKHEEKVIHYQTSLDCCTSDRYVLLVRMHGLATTFHQSREATLYLQVSEQSKITKRIVGRRGETLFQFTYWFMDLFGNFTHVLVGFPMFNRQLNQCTKGKIRKSQRHSDAKSQI